ncbi:MAG: site-2 protease family protein [Phycisphaerales bacterium JB058]
MGIHDRDWGGSSDRGRWARIFGDGENPLKWSLPLYKAWGIAVRIHLIFVIIILARLIGTVREDSIGFPFMLVWMGGLFVLVLLHEYGHCIACRKVGGDADEILMWPLGGLAYCLPPNTWRANLITVVGGPLVNVLFVPIFAGAILALGGGWNLVFFNPLDLNGAIIEAQGLSFAGWAAWSMHFVNVFMLAFNLLVPMYPLDGSRILHALIWRKAGRRRADEIISRTGLVTALVLGTLAIVGGQMMVLGIALFGGFVSYQEMVRARFLEGPDEDWSMSFEPEPDPPSRGKKERGGVDPEEIDRILAKISSQGMQSLTRSEKKKLGKASSQKD